MTDHEYHEALDASAPAETDEDIARAKRILQGLGFCGHYMHFHGGGRSGRCPSCACSTAVGADSRSRNSDLALRSSPARCRRSYPKWSVRGSLSVRATPRTAVSFSCTSRRRVGSSPSTSTTSGRLQTRRVLGTHRRRARTTRRNAREDPCDLGGVRWLIRLLHPFETTSGPQSPRQSWCCSRSPARWRSPL